MLLDNPLGATAFVNCYINKWSQQLMVLVEICSNLVSESEVNT
jgi:hypothetical protein